MPSSATIPKCFLELTEPEATALFSILSRVAGIPGSKQTHRSRLLNALKDQLDEFEAARLALVKEHAKKDEKGEPALDATTNTYPLIDPEAFTAAFKKLRAELKIIIDGRGDAVKNNALHAVYEMLESDHCPNLSMIQGRPLEESEMILFAPVLDAFKFDPPKA